MPTKKKVEEKQPAEDFVVLDQGKAAQIPSPLPPPEPEIPHRIAIDPTGRPLATYEEHRHHFLGIIVAIVVTFGVNTGMFLAYNEYVVKPRELAMQVKQNEIMVAAQESQKQAQALIEVLTSKSKTLKAAVANELGVLGFKAKP